MKFKCKLTGCVYEFTTEHDVKTMKEHPDYIEVVEQEVKSSSINIKKVVKNSSNLEES